MGELALLPCERSSIVPGTFQWLPRGPCSGPSPHRTVFNPHTQIYRGCVAHFLMFHTALSVSFRLSPLSSSPHFTEAKTAFPPPARPRLLIISPH